MKIPLRARPAPTAPARDCSISSIMKTSILDLCGVIGMPELKTDPRFAERNIRIRNREQMRAVLEQALQAKSAVEWERLFDEAGVPAGRIFTIPEILAHPQIESRKLIKRFKNVPGSGRDLAVPRVGFHLSRAGPAGRRDAAARSWGRTPQLY